MLSQLYIEHVAVIEKACVDFHKGLMVLTGETGAGKSILIDSVNAVLGERTSRELIRTGNKNARILALFENIPSGCAEKAKSFGYEPEDGTLLLQRDISSEGKSVCRINGKPATVSILREIGRGLLSIHGQHENYELLSSELHREYVDRLGVEEELLQKYKQVFGDLKSVEKKLSEMITDESEKARRIDLLRYQIQELEEAQIQPGEREELAEQRTLYQNSEKISSSLETAFQILSGTEETDGVVSFLQTASNAVEAAAQYVPDLKELAERMQSLVYDLEDCEEELRSFADKTEFDPRELESIEDRLDLLYRLGMKYGATEEEMLAYLEECSKELETIEFSEEIIAELLKKKKSLEENAWKLAEEISSQRMQAGKILSKRIQEELRFLNMPAVEFLPRQTRCELTESGCDKIEFLISTNPGEAPRPLVKIASGGELSRIMLAIKTVLAEFDPVGTMVFDEIDTGISGSAAQKVGLKLKEVSKYQQVICVTHSAQIAALADVHYLIEKHVSEGRTYTDVHPLDESQRIEELARIMGGEHITELMRQNSAEMLHNAKST